jgi:hypothetical protein
MDIQDVGYLQNKAVTTCAFYTLHITPCHQWLTQACLCGIHLSWSNTKPRAALAQITCYAQASNPRL